MQNFTAVVGSGTLRSSSPDAVEFPHRWSDAGVTIETTFTGAHLLHLAVAGCVLNDVYREAQQLTLDVAGVRVTADGQFDPDSWQTTGITYVVELDSEAPAGDIESLLATVDAVAEIPKAIRLGGDVTRRSASN